VNTADLLEHCLNEIAAGRTTAAACAAAHPELPDLLAQLRAAEALRALPRPTVSHAAALRHQARLRQALARRPAPRARLPLFLPRWAVAALLVVALLAGGLGTVSASASSLPGQPLYPVKRGTENVQTALTPAAGQAAWHAALADRRTGELLALASPAVATTTDPALVTNLASDINHESAAALANVDRAPREAQAALLQRVLDQLDRQQAALQQALANAPAPAQGGLETALAVSRGQHVAALAALGEVDPPEATLPPATDTPAATVVATSTPMPDVATDLPPGQAKKTATAAIAATTTVAVTDEPHRHGRRLAAGRGAKASATPPGNATIGAPNCHANNPNSPNFCTPTPGPLPPPVRTPNCHANSPNSPNYCTPTPGAPEGSGPGGEGSPPATPCPLNPAGNPVCNNKP
jgi:hypothetical protein